MKRPNRPESNQLSRAEQVIENLKEWTVGSRYESRIYLVGGYLRDRLLGRVPADDLDFVIEGGGAPEMVEWLDDQGRTDHHPVIYRRFGTAMVSINGVPIEAVSPRSESYELDSRKPDVRPASLQQDALRRDFTANTLMQNLHTGEILDLTGRARLDIEHRILRTPLDPETTFDEDPLRMLRAIRFAARLDFTIESETWSSIRLKADRLNIVSAERVRDELVKMAMDRSFPRAMELLFESGLLSRILPELTNMAGVTQNSFHIYDVWRHTVESLRYLPETASLALRLGLLFHDVGKPVTRTEDERGVHFYGHQCVGAVMAQKALRRLRFPGDTVQAVTKLVDLHMRLGEYRPEWSEGAVRRLIRSAGPLLDDLFMLAVCDMAAANPDAPKTDLPAIRRRIERVNAEADALQIQSPLDGNEIMQLTGVASGPKVGEMKGFLQNEVMEGRLQPGDKESAIRLLLEHFSTRLIADDY